MNRIKTAIGIALFFAVSAHSLTVDLSPIQVGNTWAYKDSMGRATGFNIFPYEYVRTLQIVKAIKGPADTSSIIFDVSVRDSGWKSYVTGVMNFDTSFTVKSIVKTRTSVTSAGILSTYFRFSKMDTASWDSTSSTVTNYGRFISDAEGISYRLYYNSVNPGGGDIDSLVYRDKIGFTFGSTMAVFKGAGIEQVERLMSFSSGMARISFALADKDKLSITSKGWQSDFRKLTLIQNLSGNRLPFGNAMFDVRGCAVQNRGSRIANGVLLFDIRQQK
jgi:hypothetical protein